MITFDADDAARYEAAAAHPCATCNATKRPRWVEVAPGRYQCAGWRCPACEIRVQLAARRT